MMLQSLRPRAGADILQLKDLLEGRGWRGSLPSALPDAVLLGLARDFRTVECSATGECSEEPVLAPPLYAVMNLLMQHPAHGSEKPREFDISERGMTGALQAYQWAVEREIVSRIVGIGSSRDVASLLVAIDDAAKQ